MKKKNLFFLVIFFICLLGKASSYADSLHLKLKNAKTDVEKINLNLRLANYYQHIETQRAMVFSKTALVLAKKSNDQNLIGKSYTEIGLCYSFNSVTDTAALYFDSAYVMFAKIKSKIGLAEVNLYIGENLYSTASWDKALFHFQKSIENYEFLNDKNGLSKGYGKVSEVLMNMNRLDEALFYARKGIYFSITSKNDSETAKLYNSLGVVFDYKGELDSALIYYSKSLEINNRIHSKYDAGISLMNIGVIYLAQNKIKLSEQSTLNALDLMIELDDQGSVAACYINLGEIYSNQGLYSKSIEYLDKGLKMLYSLNHYDFIIEGLRIKSSVLKLNKDFEQSLLVYEKYTSLKDSLFSSESNRNMAEMQAKFKNREQEVEIKLHQAENAKQKSINNLIIGLGVFVFIVALFLVFAYREKRTAN